MPTVKLHSYNITDGPNVLASQVDTSATLSAYYLEHLITAVLGTPEVAARDDTRYTIELTTESGANATAGLGVYYATVTYTITKLDESA
jgi:hypothetical protein